MMRLVCRLFGHSRFEIPVVRLPSLEPIRTQAWCRRCFSDLGDNA